MTLMFKAPDGSEHDFDALPAASRNAMVNRAVTHIFGNEVASSVTAKIKTTLDIKADDKSAASKALVQSYRTEKPEAISAWVKEFQAVKLGQILEGSLGARTGGSGGSTVDPLTKEMRKIAVQQLSDILGSHSLKLPSGDGTIEIRGQMFDREALVARHLSQKGEAIEREAKAELARRARAKEATIKAAGDDVAAALGL